MKNVMLSCAAGVLVFAGVGVAQAVPSYTDGLLTPFSGFHPTAQGTATGVTVADYDGDGDVDVFVACGLNFPNRLYQNQGDGTFVDVAFDVGLANGGNQRAGVWMDADADGDLDLIVVGDNFKKSFGPYNDTTCWLYLQQPDHTFVDATVGSGLDFLVITPENDPPNSASIGGVAAGDVTGDGLPDLVVTFWWGPTQVYQNHGDGTFTDITVAAGTDDHTSHWQPVLVDVDDDGDLDIFVAVDFYDNKLFINDGTGTFTEEAEAHGMDNSFNEMGIAPGDYDNDGDIDFFVTNIFEENTIYAGTHNILMRNDMNTATPGFVEVSIPTGVAYGGWGWGCTFTDGDLDGDLDLAQTNGFYTRAFPYDPSYFFVNDGSAQFTNMAGAVGVTDTDWGSGFVAADIDRDGDQDLLQVCKDGPIRLYTNNADPAPGGSWLVVKPRMDGPNTHALGAKVRITVNGQTQMRLITAGTSMMSQEPAEAHFGLNGATMVDRVVVEWPGGHRTCKSNVPAGQVLTLMAPPAGGLNGFVTAFAGGAPSADRNGDGAVDAADVRSFLKEQASGCK